MTGMLRLLVIASAVLATSSPLGLASASTAYPKLASGIYVDTLSGSRASGPHYVFFMHVKGPKVHGDLDFEYQDGTIGHVHSFHGHQSYGVATLRFSNRKTETATIKSTKHFELSNCHAVMKFAESRFPDCQFRKVKHATA